MRRRSVELDGVRDARADPDRDMDIGLVITMDSVVVNEDAVNAGLLFARNAGEAFAGRAASPFRPAGGA